MEARLEGEPHRFFGLSTMNLQPADKRSLEWNPSGWKWDGDLFIARPLNPVSTDNTGRQFFPLGAGVPVSGGNSSNSSSSCSDEGNVGIQNGRGELERKRRAGVVENHNSMDNDGGLTLKLAGHGYPVSEREPPNWEGNGGKKTKLSGGNVSRSVCQVEGCGSDLSKAKDYHRRHKVCEMHSKASRALVGGLMQRFCQQCSRFHVLEEFDEGKRSCRRRLAGHNKRRRKTNHDAGGNGNSLNEDQTSSYLLISLLKILSNMHSNRPEETTNQDLLSHLLRSLSSRTIEQEGKNIPGLLQETHNVLNGGTSALLSNEQGPSKTNKYLALPASEKPQQDGDRTAEVLDNSAGQMKINNFDLNDTYIDSDDGTEDVERSPIPTNLGASSLDCPSWVQQDSHQSSPPQTSGNSDSASAQSPCSSNGDGQSRTDRIVFKLFGKEPNEFPVVLRAQIFDWLSHSPSDIESYIRPGCIILTIYLRQPEAAWEDLCSDLSWNLSRLMDLSDDSFWTSGWTYVRVQNQIAFASDGQVVVDTSLPLRSHNYSKILSVKPIAVSAFERTQFSVNGVNLCQPATRLLVAVEGEYLVQEMSPAVEDGDDTDRVHSVNFSCTIPTIAGRGFIEVEDQNLSSSFFPFIVAEGDVCSDIRMLESALEFTESDTDADALENGKSEAKREAMDFIHEFGWLLHRYQVNFRLGYMNPNVDLFSLKRFKWLIEFSVDHEWSAVVRKLLNILLDGTVDAGEHPSIYLALSEMCVLHRAVRKNSRPLVELLLKFTPKQTGGFVESHQYFLFTPDVTGPAGLTPLHIAAGKDGSEDVLDALTEDPGMVGIEAWKTARDSTGSTPEDYARLRGHYSYIHLIQRKINKRQSNRHVVVDIPSTPSDLFVNQKPSTTVTSGFEIGQLERKSILQNCKLCDHKKAYGTVSRTLAYRPAMLSMLAVAAVCVCVALLFKSSPEVLFMFRPFQWESLEFGTS